MPERLQVGERLPRRRAPRPLPPDRRGEAALQDGIEIGVRGGEKHAQHCIDLGGIQRSKTEPTDQVDIPHGVDAVAHGPQFGVALQQVSVHLAVVLVGLTADEGLDQQVVIADEQPDQGAVPALAWQCQQEGAGLRRLERHTRLHQGGPHDFRR